ncbi:MAG TPA: hypothetical protein PK357_00120 [Candidatus Pacearchaeota archaeon]|nr:hypothetical protein [Candidatus Pacearchaeota archaeon]
MEITIGNIIKIILAVLVVVAVAYGLYRFFSNSVISHFKNIGIGNTSIELWMSLL